MAALGQNLVVTRSVGFAILRVDKRFTIDEVVFGEPGNIDLLDPLHLVAIKSLTGRGKTPKAA